MAEVNNAYSLLLPEEDRLVIKTRNLREKMVDNYIEKNGVPDTGRDMRVVNEVLDSLDSNVFGMVDKRLKHEENAISGDFTETIVKLFSELDNRKDQQPNIKIEMVVDDKIVPDDVVPGEDIIEYKPIEIEEIITEDEL